MFIWDGLFHSCCKLSYRDARVYVHTLTFFQQSSSWVVEIFLQWHFKNLAQNRSHIFTHRVVKQTSVCEREGVSFLWVFIFHSCSTSFFLPVQTEILCQHQAWSCLMLKVTVTNFLLSFKFFRVTDFQLQFQQLQFPPNYSNGTFLEIFWSFDWSFKEPSSALAWSKIQPL